MPREKLELLSFSPDGPHTELVVILSTRNGEYFDFSNTGQFMMDHTPARYYVKGVHADIYGEIWDAVMYHDWPNDWVVEAFHIKDRHHLTRPSQD